VLRVCSNIKSYIEKGKKYIWYHHVYYFIYSQCGKLGMDYCL